MATAIYRRVVDRMQLPVANGLTVRDGDVAILDPATGKLVAVSASTTVVPIGYHTAYVVGDGVKLGTVLLAEPVTLTRRIQSLASPVLHVGAFAYAEDAVTASRLSTQPLLGLCMDMDATGVWIAPVHTAGAGYSAGAGLLLTGSAFSPDFGVGANKVLMAAATPLAGQELYYSGSLAAPSWRYSDSAQVQAADAATITSATLVDMGNLTYSLLSGVTVQFEFEMALAILTAAGVPGFSINFSGTTSMLRQCAMLNLQTTSFGTNTSATKPGMNTTNNTAIISNATGMTVGTDVWSKLWGTLTTTSAGTLTLRAQTSAGGLVLKAGSSARIRAAAAV